MKVCTMLIVKVVFKDRSKIVDIMRTLWQIVLHVKMDSIYNKVCASNMKIKLFVKFIPQL